MTKKRIFIAINLSEKVRKRLKEYQEKFDYLPARWTKLASLHLTLVFIGYVDNEQMLEACKIAREVAGKADPFFINFKRIALGPKDKASRMIWLEAEKNPELDELKKALEEALLSKNAGLRKVENRPFSPHITLARLKMEQWKEAQINPADVEQDFKVQFEVKSIEVMESDLKFDGAEYATLESCPLGVDE
ncbi:MAG: RNA 2',3'-cyclic phosphodiesterase [Candidatus Portnoybacteria bacterium]|nr:RNA 2',3'-cyclic phosphodiesterase [Candidatus Portnoybacteria bacterium]MDD4983074.1 RNA 2',3'-cyclic phosphodiesterase [Candidatus Portnoybacteria bacterium]